jgi:hypothetical protein
VGGKSGLTSTDVGAPVVFEERVRASEHRIGCARLSRPKQRNALNREMCTLMFERFREWRIVRNLRTVVRNNSISVVGITYGSAGAAVA